MYKSIEERKSKWLDFLDPGCRERTVFNVNVDADAFRARLGPRPLPQPGLMEERINWAYDSYNLQLELADKIADDKVPALSPYTGTEIFAEAFGCGVRYPSNDMPFALPKYFDIKDAAAMKTPDFHDTPLYDLFEAARRLLQRAGSGAALQLPDVQSPLGVAALILRKEEFYVAMSEEPQAVHEMVAKTQALITAFIDEWFREFGHKYIAHYPSYYMDSGITLSEDEIGAFSPTMFEEFCLNPLNDLSDRYGGIGIHCCANSRHQWDNLKKVKSLQLLNLSKNTDFIKKSIQYFGNSVAQWPHDGNPESSSNPDWLADCPDDVHVVLSYRARSIDEAVSIAAFAEELCESRREKTEE